ncbi:hypothetical protein ACJMK2_003925 [Sinanodonta woodiana]|uniref:Uncharacterized protein n=1 Tax=Sinanodonta woodiana TaxID=1069815 RepID=A0ABD3Y2J5_SINWO
MANFNESNFYLFIIMVIKNLIICVIQTENCYEVADCNHIKCGPGTGMKCYTPVDVTVGVCTCVTSTTNQCTLQIDCNRDVCSTRDPHEHCVDGHCACLHFQP